MQGCDSYYQQESALSVVLEQPDLASDLLLLCSAARVCSSWRAAVAASGAGTTDIIIQDTASTTKERENGFTNADKRFVHVAHVFERMRGYDSWVVQHAPLIRSMQLHGEAGETACWLLEQHAEARGSLQLPSLQRFSCSHVLHSAVLAALPCSLTRLDMAVSSTESEATTSAKTLKRLTSLRRLRLEDGSCSTAVLPALQELPCLEQLELSSSSGCAELAVLQKLLPHLAVLEVLLLNVTWEFDDWRAQRRLNLGDLTTLKQLSLELCYSFRGAGVVLPAGLTELELEYVYNEVDRMNINPIRDLQLRGLQDLRHLTLRLSLHALVDCPEGVQSLVELQQLDRLDLEYNNIHTAHADRMHWPRYAALAGISIDDDCASACAGGPAVLQEDIFTVLGQLRETLTRLVFKICSTEEDEADEPDVSLCRHVSGLTKLQSLCLTPYYGYPAARDCLQLSGLRSLTHLSLPYMGSAVDDTVAAALVFNMPLLRQLDLSECELQSDSLLAVLPRCEHLTHLELLGNSGFDDELLSQIDRWSRTGLPKFGDMLLRP